jgi:hypothetical protein
MFQASSRCTKPQIIASPTYTVSSYTSLPVRVFTVYLFIYAVLGLELRAFTLSHSTSTVFFFVKDFSR